MRVAAFFIPAIVRMEENHTTKEEAGERVTPVKVPVD